MNRNARPRQHAARRAAPPLPSLHLIDIDNLVGDPRCTDRHRIARVLALYRAAAGYREGDHAIVATGTNDRHVLETELAWAAAGHRRRSGRDGADLMLLDEVDWAIRGGRYSRVVIGSGDHIFTEAVERLASAAIPVLVVAPHGAASWELVRAAGPGIHYLRLGSPGAVVGGR